MNVEIKDISSVKKELRIVVPKELVDEKFEEAYKTIGKKAKIKGFRPGKAPKALIKRNYEGTIITEIYKELINETYYKAISDNNLLPITPPNIEPEKLEEGKPFHFTAIVEIKPSLDNVTYKDFKLQKEKLLVTDEEVQKELDTLRERHATTTLIEDPEKTAENGHVITIDFEGFLEDDKPLPGGKAEDQALEIGSGMFIPGFDEEIIGMKTTEEKTIQVTFPNDYGNKELQGVKASFKIKLKEIKEKELPQLDDEFAKTLGNNETFEDLKSKTKENIEEIKDQTVQHKLRQTIIDELIHANDFEAPETLVEEQKKRLIGDANARLNYMGKENLEKYISENDGEFTKQAARNIKLFFIFEEIGKQENIDVSDADVTSELENTAKKSVQSVDEIREYYKRHNMLEDIKYRVKENKIYELIISNSTVEEKEATVVK